MSIPPQFREFLASALIAHELWGHAFAGFWDKEGHGDLMDTGGRPNFSPQHTQFLRDLMKLTPYNYLIPKNEIRLQSMGILGIRESGFPEQGISAVVSTPTGTRQLLSKIRPLNGDGQLILEQVNDPKVIQAWQEQGKKIPLRTLLPATEYLWQVCSSGLLTPLPADDPRWTQVEGWPGVFFPNPCAEVTFTTPDGMFRVYLPVVGK